MAAIGNGYYSNRSDNSFVYGGSSTKEYPFRLGSTSVSLGLFNAAKGLYVGTSPIYHPEAINWVNRAQANVGTISTETLGAVSAFCYAIDAANLRDKFLRLNLFCGNDLGACCTPLYRGPSFSSTQYGNSVDTNVGSFINDDYTETGSGGGLNGNGSDYLDTGLNTTTPFTDMGIVYNNIHNAVYLSNLATTEGWMGGLINGAVTGFEGNVYSGVTVFSGLVQDFLYNPGDTTAYGSFVQNTSYSNEGFVICSFKSGVAAQYSIQNNNRANSSQETNPGSQGDFGPTTFIYIMKGISHNAYFASENNGGVPHTTETTDTVAGYSLGTGFTLEEITAYNTIMNSFQSALGRSF